jgi:hypothetical protein
MHRIMAESLSSAAIDCDATGMKLLQKQSVTSLLPQPEVSARTVRISQSDHG